MARTAGQMPGRLSLIDMGGLAFAGMGRAGASWFPRTHSIESEDLTARAVACAGLAALVGLPVLLLSSVVFSAPLAVPAAIALGYLGTSYALASHRPRGAAAINALVLTALVAWSLSSLLTGDGMSHGVLAAAMLAPIFAAAPAIARFAILPRRDPALRAALRNTACLDQLAPGEPVLVVRRDGSLLSATRAARTALRVPEGVIGRDVGRLFGVVDRPKLGEAVARCRPGELIELTLEGVGGKARQMASVSVMEGDAVSIRLEPAVPRQAAPLESKPVAQPKTRARALCEVCEAVGFAISFCCPDVDARAAMLTSKVEAELWVGCELQLCRRIVRLMIDTALLNCGQGARLHLTGRHVKAVVLLQLVATQDCSRTAEPSTDEPRTLATLRETVEGAGGTVMIDGAGAESRISVRLDAVGSPEANEGKPGEVH